MKNAFASLVALLLGVTPLTSVAEDNVVMIELFTSQGCSSCPPADANLQRLIAEDGVLALSLHVDYWDYLGWRDTFARREHTERQIAYRDAMGARVIYTPQMIVEGTFDVPGYRLDMIREVLVDARQMPRSATITIAEVDGMLAAEITATSQNRPCEIWVATYDREARVRIARGENAGREISYHNVVEKMMRVGPWQGPAKRRIDLPQPSGGGGVAIWLQEAETGRIVTASFRND